MSQLDTLGLSRERGPAGCQTLPEVPGYELLEVLGYGGMGVVYKARQQGLNRSVALKMILAGRHASPQERARFRSEAESLARLQHPHIVQIYEVGEQDGCPYMALELLEGGTLETRLAGTPLPPREAAELLATLALTLHAAHECGIVHRDLKPANVLLHVAPRLPGAVDPPPASRRLDGVPKVADFGLAKQLGSSSGQTQSGVILGTPSYMAPEQAAGKGKDVGPAADTYALGVLLYECLTGRPPFKAATTLDTLLQVVANQVVPPSTLQPGLPRDLETICLKCLHKEPGRRYASALDLGSDLRRFLDGRPIAARPVGPLERLARWCRRSPVVAALVVAVALSLVAGTAAATFFAVRANQAAGDARDNAAHALAESEQARQHLLTARRNLYVADLNRAQRAWADSEVGRVRELLHGQSPEQTGGDDLRGFEWYYLWRLCHADLLTLRVPGYPARHIAIHPDGRLVAAACESTVRVWDVTTGTEILALNGGKQGVTRVAFSPDGKRLAAGGHDSTVRIWDTATGQPLLTFKEHTDGVLGLAFSPDSTRIASAGGNTTPGELKVWDVVTGRAYYTLPAQGRNNYLGVCFSPDGHYLATACYGTITLRDAATGEPILAMPDKSVNGWGVAFSPDSRRLAVTGHDGTVKVWQTGASEPELVLKGHRGKVQSVCFSPDGKRLISAADEDPAVRVWDAATGQELFTLRGHLYAVASVALAADGRRLVSCSPDNTVKVWDAGTDPAVVTLAGHRNFITGVAISSGATDGGRRARVASASQDGTARVWDADSGRELLTLTGHQGPLTAVCFSPDGRLATAGVDRTVRIWDVDALLRGAKQGPVILHGHDFDEVRMAFTADGKRLLAGSYTDGPRAVLNPEPLRPLRIWDAFTGAELPPLPGGHARPIYSVAASADGRWWASGADKAAKVWDARTGAEVLEIKAAEKSWGVLGLAFRPDGRWLATTTQDQTVRVWETETGREVFALKGHRRNALGVAFSGDGKRLASAADDVKLWDLTSGQEVFSLPGGSRVAFSGDGKYLAACGPGNTILVWSAEPLANSSGAHVPVR